MTASERTQIGKKRSARESFMLSYEARRRGRGSRCCHMQAQALGRVLHKQAWQAGVRRLFCFPTAPPLVPFQPPQVSWPLSIAAPEAALAQYQMVFRHIFELKWVERELTRVAAIYGQTTGLASRRARMWARRESTGSLAGSGAGGGGDVLAESLALSYSACQLMTHFFRQYLLYVTFEVMEPLWGAFERQLQTAGSLDEVGGARGSGQWMVLGGCRDFAAACGVAIGETRGTGMLRQHAESGHAGNAFLERSTVLQPLRPSQRLTWLQIVEQHRAFLRRLMKGCLLSRKVSTGTALYVCACLAGCRSSLGCRVASWHAVSLRQRAFVQPFV